MGARKEKGAIGPGGGGVGRRRKVRESWRRSLRGASGTAGVKATGGIPLSTTGKVVRGCDGADGVGVKAAGGMPLSPTTKAKPPSGGSTRRDGNFDTGGPNWNGPVGP